jgi:hypothetical protein
MTSATSAYTPSGYGTGLTAAKPPGTSCAKLATVIAVESLVLAHQGGWDEMLMVLGPILLFWWILRTARRRAERAGELIATAPEGTAHQPAEPDTAPLDES